MGDEPNMKKLFFIVLYALIIVFAGCGKKGPPVYNLREFSAFLEDLRAYEEAGKLTLTGKINYPDKKSKEEIAGSRVYLSEYELNERPCSSCPIKYQRYFEQGPSAIKGDSFFWTFSGIKKNKVYILEVRLLNKYKQEGPPSEKVEIITYEK